MPRFLFFRKVSSPHDLFICGFFFFSASQFHHIEPFKFSHSCIVHTYTLTLTFSTVKILALEKNLLRRNAKWKDTWRLDRYGRKIFTFLRLNESPNRQKKKHPSFLIIIFRLCVYSSMVSLDGKTQTLTEERTSFIFDHYFWLVRVFFNELGQMEEQNCDGKYIGIYLVGRELRLVTVQ